MFMLGRFSQFPPQVNCREKVLGAYITYNAPQIKDCPALGVKEILRKSAYNKRTKLKGN